MPLFMCLVTGVLSRVLDILYCNASETHKRKMEKIRTVYEKEKIITRVTKSMNLHMFFFYFNATTTLLLLYGSEP